MNVHPTRSLLSVASGHLAIELSSNYLPVVYPALISTLGLDYTEIGIIAMVASTGVTLAQPLFGHLSDRWNPYRIVALSIAWTGIVLGLVGVMHTYVSLLLVVGLGALGSAAFHPAAAMIASANAGTRRGAAVSIFSIGGALGTALSPLCVAAGMRWLGMRGTLVLIPLPLLISVMLYRQLKEKARPAANRSGDCRRPLTTRDLVGLLLIVGAVMSLAWFRVAFVTYLPIWVQSQGRPLEAGGRMLSLFVASAGVGSLLGGVLSDRVGRWTVLTLCLALVGPMEWLFLIASTPLQLVLIALMGTMIGATFPVSIVMAQEAWPERVGIASGIVMGLGWLPGGVGASFTGLLADHYSLAMGLGLLPLPLCLGLVCVLLYKWMLRLPSQ
jgi:FSR family fosmidomycin resistance protein-like MFS transporter